jgi:cell wall-associated NlpC family hydrolase
MLTEDQTAALCRAARSYLGVPWRGQGRDHKGIDCTGLIEMSFVDAGLPVVPKRADYRGVDSKLLVGTLLAYCDRIPAGEEPLPGDVVVYGVPFDAHCALIVDGRPLNAIHSPMNGHVVEARFDPKRGHIRGIYRWR